MNQFLKRDLNAWNEYFPIGTSLDLSPYEVEDMIFKR
jgi:hypothetical protein